MSLFNAYTIKQFKKKLLKIFADELNEIFENVEIRK